VKTTLAVLSLATLAVVAGGCGGGTAASPVTVDPAATPPGWVAVDYGAAQISVPADWVVGACPTPSKGTVILGTVLVNCPAYESSWPAVRVTPATTPVATKLSIRVNGITVYPVPYRGPGHDIATDQVPSLGVQVNATGPLYARILATLTHSPRGVVLARGSAPAPPGTWHRVTFGGVSMSVPSTWPVERSEGADACEPWAALPPNLARRVHPYRGSSTLVPCQFTNVVSVRALSPVDGVVIDPGAAGPFPSASSDTSCPTVNKIAVCRAMSQPLDVLILGVPVPGQSHPVVVELGLGGRGLTARTIFWSLSAA